MCKKLFLCVWVSLLPASVTLAQEGLIGYWQFDEGQGNTTADSSDSGNDGTLDGATWTTGYGGDGSALSFNGSSSFVDCGNDAGNGPTDALTVAAWVNINTLANWVGFVTKGMEGASFAMQMWGDGSLRLAANWGFVTGTGGGEWNSVEKLTTGVWTHIAITLGEGVVTFYLNGEISDTLNIDLVLGENLDEPLIFGCDFPGGDEYYDGVLDEVKIYDIALTQDEIKAAMEGVDKFAARSPVPGKGEKDVVRDGIELMWAPGQGAVSHDVYLGTSEEDVTHATINTPLGVLLSAGQAATSIVLPRLPFGGAQYWRVDEVAADNTRSVGKVWSFEVEPYSVQIPGGEISVLASSYNANADPNFLIDGSGLTGDTHSTANMTGWLSTPMDLQPSLVFEFAEPHLLDKMLVWNSNTTMEPFFGLGAKDITLEASMDGETWTVVEGVTSLTKAPGNDLYNTPDNLVLNGVLATQVRIQIASHHSEIPVGTGLAEVQFYAIPIRARSPYPANQAVDVLPDVVATWRAGREAGMHRVMVSQDVNAVAEGVSATSNTNSIDMSTFDLLLGETYFWQVTEVNENNNPSEWSSDVWTLSTANRVMVDDFEGYTNFSPDRPFQTWLDGIGYSADDFFTVAFTGNGTGAAVGHDIWSVASPHFEGEIMEQILTAEATGQSMPIYFSGNSKVDRTFASAQDWSMAGINTLVLYFNGDRANDAASLYITINGQRLNYSNSAALSSGLWTQWNVDLASVDTNLSQVNTMSIGIDSSGSGMVLVDQISLYRDAPEVPVSKDPGTANLAALYSFENDYADSSGHGLTGIPMGAPAFENGLPGNGMAVTLNGADDYIELPIGSLMSTLTDCTFAIWANFSGQGGNWQRLIDLGSGTSQYVLITPSRDTGVLMMEMNGAADVTSTNQVNAPMQLPSGWHHVAGVIDSTSMEMTLYLDGAVVGQGTTDTLPADMGITTQNWLGRSQYQDPYFDGSLDEFRIYNRALSEGEIRYLAGDK